MHFGQDPEAKEKAPYLKRKEKITYDGGGTDDQPKPVRHRKPSTIVIASFQEQWETLVQKRPEYVMYVSVDKVPFSSYLNEKVFNHGMSTVEGVLAIVARFMSDLEHGNVVLQPGQAAWKAFTKYFSKNRLQPLVGSDKVSSLLERLQAKERKV